MMRTLFRCPIFLIKVTIYDSKELGASFEISCFYDISYSNRVKIERIVYFNYISDYFRNNNIDLEYYE